MSTNIPRERISWFPTIDYEACLGDRTCYEFCHNDVFVWDEVNECSIVQNPLNCVVGCMSCAQICPTKAITFPDKDELRKELRRLREELQGSEARPANQV